MVSHIESFILFIVFHRKSYNSGNVFEFLNRLQVTTITQNEVFIRLLGAILTFQLSPSGYLSLGSPCRCLYVNIIFLSINYPFDSLQQLVTSATVCDIIWDLRQFKSSCLSQSKKKSLSHSYNPVCMGWMMISDHKRVLLPPCRCCSSAKRSPRFCCR